MFVSEGRSELRGIGRSLTKKHTEILEGDGYVHHLDCEDSFTGTYTCQNLKCTLYKTGQWAVPE